jgi:site-specific DNA-methyltransferase (adenine-specific)
MDINIDLRLGNCLDIMQEIPDKSIDLILCDPPYGTTAIAWDKPLAFGPLWDAYERIIKDNGAILIFSSQPFTTDLINSNRRLFKYEIIWKKTTPSGFLNANKAPLRAHENICVFYKKLPTYNPIKFKVERNDLGRVRHVKGIRAKQYRDMGGVDWTETGERFPLDVIEYSNWNGVSFGKKRQDHSKHPTQKPVDLCEYLIRTYSNPGHTVLDNCMGSGSTGVACVKTGRNFIGIELRDIYFCMAQNRIYETQQPLLLVSEITECREILSAD